VEQDTAESDLQTQGVSWGGNLLLQSSRMTGCDGKMESIGIIEAKMNVKSA
jgi:hypothetical protein